MYKSANAFYFRQDARFLQHTDTGSEHKNAFGNRALLDGLHYFEVLVDARSEPGLVIGVTLETNLPKQNKSFADFESGFGY